MDRAQNGYRETLSWYRGAPNGGTGALNGVTGAPQMGKAGPYTRLRGKSGTNIQYVPMQSPSLLIFGFRQVHLPSLSKGARRCLEKWVRRDPAYGLEGAL